MKQESLCMNVSHPQGCGGEGRKSYAKPELWVCELELQQPILAGSLEVLDTDAGEGIGALAPSGDMDLGDFTPLTIDYEY